MKAMDDLKLKDVEIDKLKNNGKEQCAGWLSKRNCA